MEREAERLQGRARGLVAKAAAQFHGASESSVSGRPSASVVAASVGIAFKSGVRCDRCESAAATTIRTHAGHTSAFCRRCRPRVDSHRVADLSRLVASWKGRGGEMRSEVR